MKARRKGDPGLPGDWRITDTEFSNEDFAELFLGSFIRIGKRGDGCFRIGLVWGDIRGKFVWDGGGERFEFGWEKDDEDGYACGNGWAKAGRKGGLRGEIRDASGDWVKFRAKRVIPPPAEAGGVSRISPPSIPPGAEAPGVPAKFVKARGRGGR